MEAALVATAHMARPDGWVTRPPRPRRPPKFKSKGESR
jgi:hypothetical protein